MILVIVMFESLWERASFNGNNKQPGEWENEELLDLA